MSLNLGAYIHLFEGTNNTQRSSSVVAVALNPSDEKGEYHFVSLRTGRKLHGFIWTELPIIEEVVTRVEEIDKEDNQPMMFPGLH